VKQVDANAGAGQRLSDAVYRSLRRAIIEQALAPATRLPEDTIGEQFRVSRTVVRQALSRLQAEGLVEIMPNRGAFIARPSLDEAKDTFEMRHCLEREVIRKLAKRISVNDIGALRAHVKKQERARDQSRNVPRAIRLAGEFHVILAERTGNVLLTRYVSEVVSRCSLILAVYHRAHSADCAIDEHHQIIQALKDGDADTAMRIMDEHLGAVESRAQLIDEQPLDLKTVLDHYAKDAQA
jgi:DNA-binding GntR family transcriptional regulator